MRNEKGPFPVRVPSIPTGGTKPVCAWSFLPEAVVDMEGLQSDEGRAPWKASP
ncbi:hypothetical protein [Alkalicoccus saliphilus]|uniref:hypothetical protein n=1 Tax=Alkalicoccus saliphilus TaxID=200989 RepID=UPI00135B9AF5|nr:hypothetical protein [Alkalicoccus saliphilus]